MLQVASPRALNLMAVATAAALLLPLQLGAQQPSPAAQRAIEQQLGPGTTHADILRRIRESGLTRAQAKARLQQLGYDPSIADQYYDALEAQGEMPAGQGSEEFAEALEGIRRAPRPEVEDTLVVDPMPVTREDSLQFGGHRLPLFGRELFTGVTSEFQPVLFGPVDADYRLGPGDEVLVVLTGGVESAYALEVNRQGQLIVPDVGPVPVNGQTIASLESVLRRRMGDVFAGIRGPEPTIQLQVSLGRLRTNQVYLIGEVERPGAYQVSGVASAFNALYRAGGPTLAGSFRTIRVWRQGEVVGTIDLYDYLVSGDGGSDIRLENGDRIHVPLAGARAAVRGAVPRSAVYELRQGETLIDLLRYAGGFSPDALVSRVQIDRILPPTERVDGKDRVLVDVDVAAVLAEERPPVRITDGDVVEVFNVSEERRNRVSVRGAVRRPGTYEWSPQLTLWELIGRADGLAETAYTPRAHIYRLNEVTGDRRLVQAALEADSLGRPAHDVPLSDRDSVVVFSRSELRTPESVHVSGYVKEPGTYPMAEGMTLKDLILAAGGFTEGAHTPSAEVARRPNDLTRNDTAAVLLQVPLAAPPAEAGGDNGGARVPRWYPEAEDFRLEGDDRVFIRKARGYEDLGVVAVTGEVDFPGRYVLSRRRERLTQVLGRAGGFTSEAYVPGIRLMRGGKLVAVDATQALDDPGGAADLVVEPGDSIHISAYDPTVLVQGAVNFEARVLYRPGKGLDYYIDQAGGYGEFAARDRVSVTQQNGERATVRPFLTMQRAPRVTPGSVVYVPALPESERRGINFTQLLSSALSVGSVTATLLLAISQLTN